MQNRYVESGLTVNAEGIQFINKSLHKSGILLGGDLSLNGEKVVFGTSSVMLPNGIVLYETEDREMIFNENGWRTVFYKFVEDQVLGGQEVQLVCKEGVYSQEELIETDDGENQYSTIVGWINKTTSGFELVKPNTELYPDFNLNSDDSYSDRILGRDLLTYFEDTNVTPVSEYDQSLGRVTIDPYSGSFVVQNEDVIIRVPFSMEALGTFVLERKASAGAEMRFEFESLNDDTNISLNESLTGEMECKGNDSNSWTKGSISILKTLEDEAEYTRFVIRPEQKPIDNEDVQHPDIPRSGVLKITIKKPAGMEGSDGPQYIRSIGFSKYNVPQILPS